MPRRTAADKVLHVRDKASNIARNVKYDGYQRGFASVIYNFFDKKALGVTVKSEIRPNQQLKKLKN